MSAEWMADGKCREYPPETFFPRDGMGVIVAQRICATCPVASECLVTHWTITSTTESGAARASASAAASARAPPFAPL